MTPVSVVGEFALGCVGVMQRPRGTEPFCDGENRDDFTFIIIILLRNDNRESNNKKISIYKLRAGENGRFTDSLQFTVVRNRPLHTH